MKYLKKSKKSGIPKSVLDANPDLDPTNLVIT